MMRSYVVAFQAMKKEARNHLLQKVGELHYETVREARPPLGRLRCLRRRSSQVITRSLCSNAYLLTLTDLRP
jgi:hypothetical protein